jgi:adenylate cyclase
MTPTERWLVSPWRVWTAVCAVAIAVLLIFGDPFEGMEMRWLGQLLRWRSAIGAAAPSDPRIVHLDISRADLEAMPSLESEYQNTARIIQLASDLGAKVIVIDAIFARGTPEMAQPILNAVATAANQNCTVVWAEALLPTAKGVDQRERSFRFGERCLPAGLINIESDRDGVLRHYSFLRNNLEGLEPSLALAAYLAWRDVVWERIEKSPQGISWDELAADLQSTERRTLDPGPALLDFRGRWGQSFRHYTLSDLAVEKPHALENNIIFVSYIAAGVGDVGVTPFGPNQPRVLLHSTALNDLMANSWLRRTSRFADAALIVLLLFMPFAIKRFRGAVSLSVLWFAGTVVIVTASFVIMSKPNLVIGGVMMAVVWSVEIVAELGRRYSIEFIERTKLRATMGYYFSPRVLERVLQNPGSMEPQAVELTALLSDLRNSTPIAELLGARRTFSFLNQVFEAQIRAVIAEDGTLEHFHGDEFLAYWGAPDRQADATDRAFRAALVLIRSMEELRPSLDSSVRNLFGYGVALHKGSALIGNIGSAQRLDYGVVGDLINAAARVESLTKYYGVLLLMTREVYVDLSERVAARLLDRVIVKGKSTPLELLEICHPFSAENFGKIGERYDEAFRLYQQGRFADAGRIFSELANKNSDQPSLVMAKRCMELDRKSPPNWNGVYALDAK